MKDYQGKSNEEHSMHLHNFEVLKSSLTAAEFTQITHEVAGEDYKRDVEPTTVSSIS